MEITSVNNELVKETVKLQQKKSRDESGLFLLEGFKAIEEGYKLGLNFKYVFVDVNKFDKYKFLGDKIISTTEPVLKKISTTTSAPEAVGVAHKISFDKNTLKTAKKVVLLEGIKDVGNLGTILRTSTAFNIDAIILYGDCADIYNPKCVRASVGNLCKTPVFEFFNVSELKKYFNKFERVATLPRSKNLLGEFICKPPVLVMFGSEADGLSNELIDFATNSVKIEMSEKAESLNLSVSCGILLYWLMKI